MRAILFLSLCFAGPALAFNPIDSGLPSPSQTRAFEVRGFSLAPKAISAGYPPCVILEDGNLECFQALTPASVEFTQLNFFPGPWSHIEAGNRHSCGQPEKGGLACWGVTDWGQLGTSQLQTVRHQHSFKVQSVTIGNFATCAVDTKGRTSCWGKNNRFQVGMDRQPKSGPCKKMWCVAEPHAVPDLPEATEVSLGSAHACALGTEGEVHCWGENTLGQLGAEGGVDCPPEDTLSLRCSARPLRVKGLPGPAVQVSTGTHFTCALLADGAVWCWGMNAYGQLGNATSILCKDPKSGKQSIPCSSAPVKVMDLGGRGARISAGEAHACVLLDSGEVRCWGGNAYGELGDGTHKNRNIPAPVQGIVGSVAGLSVQLKHGCVITATKRVFCWPQPAIREKPKASAPGGRELHPRIAGVDALDARGK
ncbi:MAG: hypothetical protein IT285_03275 [Bdellovibrionales bacterium]|nr:hypothetical protein [Bdellovibrionales bacterium]